MGAAIDVWNREKVEKMERTWEGGGMMMGKTDIVSAQENHGVTSLDVKGKGLEYHPRRQQRDVVEGPRRY